MQDVYNKTEYKNKTNKIDGRNDIRPQKECRERALEERDSQDKRRQGYMEKMRLLWEEKGYASLGLKAQNLRDKAAQVIKSREENRQRNGETNVNSEIEASDEINGIQEQDIHENITVCKVNNINEEVINAKDGGETFFCYHLGKREKPLFQN